MDPTWKARSRSVIAMLLAATLAGCASGPSPTALATASVGPAASPTTRPSGAPSTPPPTPALEPTPTPVAPVGDSFAIFGAPPQRFDGSIECSGEIGPADPVAMTRRAEADAVIEVLVDFVDPGRPREVCTVRGGYVQAVLDARHLLLVSHGDGEAYAIVDVPEVRYHWFQLPFVGSNDLLTVSPSLDAVVWRRSNLASDGGAGGSDVIHLTTLAGDRAVATLPDSNPGRCGTPSDSNNAAYQRSGSAFFVLDEPLPEVSLIVVRDGRIALSMIGKATDSLSSRPLKVLWSPTTETLFWTQGGNVWQWTEAGGRRLFLRGVTWKTATISPDGAHLAYDVAVSDSLDDVYLVDPAGGTPVPIRPGHHGGPVFLSDRELFVFGEGETHGCTGPEPPRPLIYDLVTATESASPFLSVGRIWPATGTHN